MRIGIISYDYRPAIGGLGSVVSREYSALESGGSKHEFIVLSPSRDALPLVPLCARRMWNKRGGCPFFSVCLLFVLPRIIKKHGLDLLHVHSGSGGVVLIRKPHVPVIVTSHHTYRQEAVFVFNGNPIKRILKQLMAMLEKRTYRIADKILCVSRDTRDELITGYGIAAGKLSVLENSIDTEKFAPLPGQSKNPNSLVYIGRIEPRKGVWTLLNAFIFLRKSQPSVTLRMIGGNLMGGQLKEFIDSNNLSHSVQVLGHVSTEQLVAELQGASAIVIPSVLEGFGLIAAEAMASGTCVVASDAPGLRSIVDHGRTGLLFPVGDADRCAFLLNQILIDQELKKRLEQNAQLEAVKRFSISSHTSALLEYYLSTGSQYNNS